MKSKKTESRTITGIEIDEEIYEIVDENIGHYPGVQSNTANAFSPQTRHQLKSEGYDLVIANPPYVRYQSMAGPDMTENRDSITKTAKQVQTLSAQDKKLFQILIANFSGAF